MAEGRHEGFAARQADFWRELLGSAKAFHGAKHFPFVVDGKVFSAALALCYWLRFCAAWALWLGLSSVKRVVFNVIHQLQVLNAVVVRNVVDVVNNLVRCKAEPNMLGHNNDVFLNIALRVSVRMRLIVDKYVPMLCSPANPLMVVFVAVKNTVMRVLAILRAVVVLPLTQPRSLCLVLAVAVIACCLDHGLALNGLDITKYITFNEATHFQDGRL